MLKIGDFSKLSRISIRMLRHYDELGLLVPEHIDYFTKYRYYNETQLSIAGRITSLKAMGFKLAVILEILSGYDDSTPLTQVLMAQKKDMIAESVKITHRLRLLDTAMKRLRKDDNIMNYNVVLKELEARQVASVRKNIPTYDDEGVLWGILMEETAPLAIKDAAPCYTLAIFHDEEYKERDVDVEVQKTVKGNYKNTEHVIFKREPSVQIASATYTGSYESMTAVNECVASWVTNNGYQFDGPAFNIYHISPHETKNPDEFVTEVCYPVQKK